MQLSVDSVDNCEHSNATISKDIREFDPSKDCRCIPDFVWMSPPCSTYSFLAGRKHRSVKDGKYEISSEAIQHNFLFDYVCKIMTWVEKANQHAVYVIENPRGNLPHMPLMEQLKEMFKLVEVTVDYCTFGRDEKKPTVLWTNDRRLALLLSQTRYQCKHSCPHDGDHPSNVRDNKEMDHSVIPEPLAALVATQVHSTLFFYNRSFEQPVKKPSDIQYYL